MKSQTKLISLLWTVILILVVGGGIVVFMLVRHASDLDAANALLTGNNDSLRRQLVEAKATPAPTVAPLPTPNQATPAPTAKVKATPTPKATAAPAAPTATPLQ